MENKVRIVKTDFMLYKTQGGGYITKEKKTE